MNEPNHQTFKIGLLLSKLNTLMSEAEAIESCKIYFEIISSEMLNNLLVLEIKQKKETSNINSKSNPKLEPKYKPNPLSDFKATLLIWLNRLALTKEAHILIGSINQNTNSPKLNSDFSLTWPLITTLTNNKQTPTFKISIRNVAISEGKEQNKKTFEKNTLQKTESFTIESFAKLLAEHNFHKTNMKTPDLEFTIINTSETVLGIKAWTNTDMFEKRRAHLRPVLHPTAINPRIARAMTNLAGAKKEIFDPFCGVGGILLEAAAINLKATGTDIDSLMVKRANINLKDESPSKISLITVHTMDALNWITPVECIVTDLPYGKSSKLDCPLDNLLTKTLIKYAELTNKAVVCFPKGINCQVPPVWRVKYTFEIYIHKSLTRNILVLEKTNNNDPQSNNP